MQRVLAAIGLTAFALFGTGCPSVPPYPYWGPDNTWTRQQVVDEANRLSTCLESYVDNWFDRGRPANELIPAVWPASGWDARTWNNPACNGKQLIPDGMDRGITNLRMTREEDIDPAATDGPWRVGQWAWRPSVQNGLCLRRCDTNADCTGGASCEVSCPNAANQVSCPKRCSTASAPAACQQDGDCASGNTCFKKGYFPDPHVTYLLLPHMLLPFGAKVIVEGEFPRARYFSLQPPAAFYPDAYKYDGFGAGEVALVDADIDPLPGHVNPYRVGANRNATNRGYRAECIAAAGNPALLDPSAWSPPYFRQAGNVRHCSGIHYRGPWGDAAWDAKDSAGAGDALGLWDVGDFWVRYYAPDRAPGATGGVLPPKVVYQLADGRRFFIDADFRGFAERSNVDGPLVAQAPVAPPSYNGAGRGWLKQMGIFRTIAEGIAIANWPDKGYVRNLDKGVTGRGNDMPANTPNYLEPHATAAVHINYFTRGMSLDAGKIYAISGRLPTFPRTRNGEATMTAAQSRYWSITSYSCRGDYNDPNWVPGQWLDSVMDDELVLNANNEYVIVWSRPADRPANATAANGVTWIPWGPESCRGNTIRWMTIGPEWAFSRSPTQTNLNWETDWASSNFNAAKLDANNRSTTFLQQYQPTRHYRTKAQFESITSPVTPAKIPLW
jgi:hypothetical protein